MRKFTLRLTLLACASLAALEASAGDLKLPDLGDASGGIISVAQEYELGQRWERMFRAQVPTSTDPFLQDYLETLIRKLATYSDLSDKRLDVLVVENPTLNAFAVPGGVVGVNTGLFNFAADEQQLASVLAHELAHVSQRHFARQLDEQRNNQVPNIAALLAGILILATQGGDAGIASISAAQAAMIDSQLRFSRQMEQEADRIGMETMVRASMDPFAMPSMFEAMLHASRFQSRPPEFLITHPLTESRVSDSKLRAQQYTRRQIPPNETYRLVKIRARMHHERDPQALVREFKAEIKNNPLNPRPVQYGLALAYLRAGNYALATEQIDALLAEDGINIFFVTLKAQIEAEQKEFEPALARLRKELAAFPSSHPLNITTAEILMKAGRYKECVNLLIKHVERRPKDDYVWYLLAESYGLAGNIFEVHRARTEYFLLNGMYDNAENHVRHALKLVGNDEHARAKLELKLKEVQRLKREELR